MTNTKLTYEDIRLLVDKIVREYVGNKNIDSVYGIPTGGVFPALLISQLLNLPLVETPQEKTLIVDDIYDSGRTMAKYNYPNKAVLVSKQSILLTYAMIVNKDDWVQFPWEKKDGNIQEHIVRLIEFIGDDPNREGLIETPDRVIKSYKELFSGYNKDPKDIMKIFSSQGYDEMIVLKDIEFYSFCEHHMLPFFGKIHIGYIPNGSVLGVSKLARLVEIYSRRLQIQEQLTNQIANALMDTLHPKGVAVNCVAKHFCMISRGVNKQNSQMVTSTLLGVFREDSKARAEFMKLLD